MSMFFFTVGRNIRIPLLDPENVAYLERVKLLASFVSGVVENWERSCDPTDPGTSLHKHLAYSIRKLAEMLPAEEIMKIPEQNFFRKSTALLERSGESLWERRRAERAFKILCSGLARVQNRLDYGLEPFTETSGSSIEVPVREKMGFDRLKMTTLLEMKDGHPILLAN